ncbi:transposase [Methylacidiphilum fumariolicum]|uniref:Transposase IS200-like domain-containing protein n=1 Tax=Methylacidiphilum fumariolicum (strain SolV) TaxID=1156937 RepID=I0JYA9_METFB|nr:transposase [Candidatus Methylacidiphilum fumarolicum]MBW6415205.1 transposase [Candidatus Methylacidiphilum fumarolicum]CCG92228.1 hypothetical protein MFUM_50019 [Methylacidiphilum fumariolicum SolV]
MDGKRWKRSKTAVYNIGYQLIWCPKYRRPVLVGEVAAAAKRAIARESQKNRSGDCAGRSYA